MNRASVRNSRVRVRARRFLRTGNPFLRRRIADDARSNFRRVDRGRSTIYVTARSRPRVTIEPTRTDAAEIRHRSIDHWRS